MCGSLLVLGVVFSSFGFAQQCQYPATIFSTGQKINIRDAKIAVSQIEDYLEKEYLVIDMSLHRCEHCVTFANNHNTDQEFIKRVTGESSCRFLTLVET